MMELDFLQVQTEDELRTRLAGGDVTRLYQACFAEPPYEELCEAAFIEEQFLQYVQNGILLLGQDAATKEIVSFLAATPLCCAAEIAALAEPYGFDPQKDWYLADLGVSKAHRRNGIAQKMGRKMLSLIPAQRVLMRTQENNTPSQVCHQKMGFSIVPGMTQFVQTLRITGETKTDKRIFLSITKPTT
jgi:ribosomal protein S18 acetylase RimI-like enzyme